MDEQSEQQFIDDNQHLLPPVGMDRPDFGRVDADDAFHDHFKRRFTARTDQGCIEIDPSDCTCVSSRVHYKGQRENPLVVNVHFLIRVGNRLAAVLCSEVQLPKSKWLPELRWLSVAEAIEWWKAHQETMPRDLLSILCPSTITRAETEPSAVPFEADRAKLKSAQQKALFDWMLTQRFGGTFDELRRVPGAWIDRVSLTNDGIEKKLKEIRNALPRSRWYFEISRTGHEFTWKLFDGQKRD